MSTPNSPIAARIDASREQSRSTTQHRTIRWRGVAAFLLSAALSVGLLVAAPTPASARSDCDLVGSGTEAVPYEVADAADLAQVGSECGLGASYRQTADITLTAPAAGTSNHTPIGTAAGKFTGSYDGAGFSITGLVIERAGVYYLGLFGYSDGAAFTDIHLVNASVTGTVSGGLGGRLIGALLGAADGVTTIRNTTVSGSVSGTEQTGGLVGEFYGTGSREALIEHSSAAVDVTSTNGTGGGLVGSAGNLTVRHSFGTGDVHSSGTWSGGLMGYAGDMAIADVYATGDVTGGRHVGGLLGSASDASITDAYARGAVTASTHASAGGLVGAADTSAGSAVTITSSYSAGSVSRPGESPTTGLLIGEPSTLPDGIVDDTSHAGADLIAITTFSKWAIQSGWATFDPAATPSRVWGICSGTNGGTPFLLWQYASNPCPTAEAKTAKKTVYFAGNSAKLTKSAKTALRKVYATAKAGSITKLKVTGVVNTRSYSLFTKRLAQARANAVISYLKSLGYTGTVTKATSKATKGAKSRKADVVFTYTPTPS